jgi:hypothetical protein
MAAKGLTIQVPPPQDVFSFPRNYTVVSFVPLTRMGRCGLETTMTWESGDGEGGHLRGVFSSEMVEVKLFTGCFLERQVHVSTSLDTSVGTASDEHGFPVEWVDGQEGKAVAHQVYVYSSPSQGALQAAPNSGFEIVHEVERIGGSRFKVTTTVIGKAVVVYPSVGKEGEKGVGYSSEAGHGGARVVQVVEDGRIKADLCIRTLPRQ